MRHAMTCIGIGAAALAYASGSIAASSRTMTPMTHPSVALHPKPSTAPAHATGQPNQTCGSTMAPHTPGQAAMAPGSAFNPDGKAGTVYAGQQPQNSRNSVSVSQYDVACSHQPR